VTSRSARPAGERFIPRLAGQLSEGLPDLTLNEAFDLVIETIKRNYGNYIQDFLQD